MKYGQKIKNQMIQVQEKNKIFVFFFLDSLF
jgi:hypothetical protein